MTNNHILIDRNFDLSLKLLHDPEARTSKSSIKCTISPGLMDSVEPRQYTTILLSGLMTLTFSGGHKEDRVVGETGAALAQTAGEAGQSQYHAEIHRVQVSALHP